MDMLLVMIIVLLVVVALVLAGIGDAAMDRRSETLTARQRRRAQARKVGHPPATRRHVTVRSSGLR